MDKLFLDSFSKSIHNGFIDSNIESDILYNPRLLTNNIKPRKKFLTTLINELITCKEFYISVAFVTSSGVATLINTLEILKKNKIKGKIIVSQYLNFTEPIALKRLLQFSNIELRIATNTNSHSKGYIFKKEGYYNFIIGSSNLTQQALSINKEWNLKVSGTNQSSISKQILDEFITDFSKGIRVTDEYLEKYEILYEKYRKELRHKEYKKYLKIEPNRMQLNALQNLSKLRLLNKKKALIISATGTGKTFLSAFDVKASGAKKMLFVVHRLNIAKKAMNTFKAIFDDNVSMGIYSGKAKEINSDFIFSTVQTFSKENHLTKFDRNYFDYIIIDESHRSGAKSYKQLINYFSPSFLLGMTATPERTDGEDIYSLFNHNIAYEIRLNDAMEENMLCPFHYYGVLDVFIEDSNHNDELNFNKLTSDERINHIIEKSKFYGCDNGVIRGLIFVSRNKEAKLLSEKLNRKGLNSIALDGSCSEEKRNNAIELLEAKDKSKKIDYIISVDIFNEGIDIPSVNQIIMLRPTESAIIFVQQLGRGLRKFKNKSYLTVIDFIGNYKNNYLIPIALFGDNSFDKDRLIRLISNGNDEIPGVSTINFDEISKERIFNSINNSNMKLFTDLKKDYFNLKNKIGEIPMMMDFVKFNSRNPYLYIEYSKSYYNFVYRVDSNKIESMEKSMIELLELFSLEINNGKRVEESLLLQILIDKSKITINEFINLIDKKYGYKICRITIESCISNLNFNFIRKSKNVLILKNSSISFHPEFKDLVSNKTFKKFLIDSINYSINYFESTFELSKFHSGFILYNKYSRKDVCRILNWEKDISSILYGYRTNNKETPCFVTYHKSSKIEDSIKYNDHFVNQKTFEWESRSNRKIKSKEIQKVINSNKIFLFIKKEDSEGTEFYFISDVSIAENSIRQAHMGKSSMPVVRFRFNLKIPIENNLYNYITDKNILNPEITTIQKNKIVIDNNQRSTIPLYNFYAAAGSFSEMQFSKDYELIEVDEKFAKKDFFAVKVIGESMNKKIPNGSICVFKEYITGTKNGSIVLVELFNNQDIDFNSHFTVKEYSSIKKGNYIESIILKPKSFDTSYKEIILNEDDFELNNFKVIGEFVSIL